MEKLKSILKNHGLKLTGSRIAVLEALNIADKPLTISEIHNLKREIDFATVFRSVKLFLSLGIIIQVSFNDKQLRYELAKGKTHAHHIMCSECGKIEPLEVCFLENIKKETDYKITDHTMEFIGICPECL